MGKYIRRNRFKSFITHVLKNKASCTFTNYQSVLTYNLYLQKTAELNKISELKSFGE